jgi:hypothetical protein
MNRSCIVFIWLIAFGAGAHAQSGIMPLGNSSRATMGATVGLERPDNTPLIGATAGTAILRHRDFTGKPCLTVGGFARRHTINPNMYDHVILTVNGCPQRIAIQVCYYNSQDCIPVEIPGNEQKEAILGTLPGEKDFRFEFREKF